mmetsp:Transcript_3632/g.8342  ORF Transcript_3632/g.8342 Transcript_3632/m.8342 type:complete len:339 (-) Transcript_3632:5-1021(-)
MDLMLENCIQLRFDPGPYFAGIGFFTGDHGLGLVIVQCPHATIDVDALEQIERHYCFALVRNRHDPWFVYDLQLLLVHPAGADRHRQLDFFLVLRPAEVGFLRDGSVGPGVGRLFHLLELGRLAGGLVHRLLPRQVFRHGPPHPFRPTVGVDASHEIGVGHAGFRLGTADENVAVKDRCRMVAAGTTDRPGPLVHRELLQHPHLVQVDIDPGVAIGVGRVDQTEGLDAALGGDGVHGGGRDPGHVHLLAVGALDALARGELFRGLGLEQASINTALVGGKVGLDKIRDHVAPVFLQIGGREFHGLHGLAFVVRDNHELDCFAVIVTVVVVVIAAETQL